LSIGPPVTFEIIPPTGARGTIVGHVPHASTFIPADVRAEILLDDAELEREILHLTDSHTDDLFAWLANRGTTLFVNHLSRLVFDPERFPDDEQEPMAAKGQGVVYTHGSRGQRLRHLDDEARADRVERLYRPYHAALEALVGGILEEAGMCTVIDCHSFPTVPLPSELDQEAGRPDICIGTDAFHTPPNLAWQLEQAFRAQGLTVKRDSPYAGTLVPKAFYRRDDRVRSVMIEVRRGLYMDEESGARLPVFDEIASATQQALGDAGAID
jgi:N-formylglutamate amidohydrolase